MQVCPWKTDLPSSLNRIKPLLNHHQINKYTGEMNIYNDINIDCDKNVKLNSY